MSGYFNPRPREGGDYLPIVFGFPFGISIHAPREGGRLRSGSLRPCYRRFQSTPPARGGDSDLAAIGHDHYIFQSTPPTRGATHGGHNDDDQPLISIHAPREGGDYHALRGNI